MENSKTEWARTLCRTWNGKDPAALLERLMADENCPAFGPAHHFLPGAALVTCSWPKTGEGELDNVLNKLDESTSNLPGAACAKWGACAAALSCGAAFAVIADNAPLRTSGWSENQAMVSNILQAIATAGAPRCCKRDARIAVREATIWFNKLFDAGLFIAKSNVECHISQQNSVCIGAKCPYDAKA